MEEAEKKRPAGGRSWRLCLVLALVMLAALVSRLFLGAALLLLLGLLAYRYRRAILSPQLLSAFGAFAILMIPRSLEVLALERDTTNRFPWAFLRLFGRHHLLLFDPGLCSPAIPLLLIAGMFALRRERLLRSYLLGFGLPFYFFCLIFMGDASARLKFQGMGILFLLPLAGLGTTWLIDRLAVLRSPSWKIALPVSAVLISILSGQGTLRTRTTLQQEYEFLLSLGKLHVSRVYTIAPDEKEGHLPIPLVLQRRTGVDFASLRPASVVRPGDLVYLGGGCFRYRVVDRVGGEMLAEETLKGGSRVWPRLVWDMDEMLTGALDRLGVGMKDSCRRIVDCAGLRPENTLQLSRTRLESRFVPETFSIGLYRAEKECYFSADE